MDVGDSDSIVHTIMHKEKYLIRKRSGPLGESITFQRKPIEIDIEIICFSGVH
jgi:hypothetical protein